MRDPSADHRPIWAPFDPDAHAGELGWIWTALRGRPDPPSWHLVRADSDDDGGQPWIEFLDGSGCEWIRDLPRGAPFIPLTPPAFTPGRDDAGMVVVRLPGGASITVTDVTPERAERIRAAVLAILIEGGAAAWPA